MTATNIPGCHIHIYILLARNNSLPLQNEVEGMFLPESTIMVYSELEPTTFDIKVQHYPMSYATGHLLLKHEKKRTKC